MALRLQARPGVPPRALALRGGSLLSDVFRRTGLVIRRSADVRLGTDKPGLGPSAPTGF